MCTHTVVTALDDGALGPVLELCTHPSQAAALLALSTLAHIVDNPGTHDTIVSSPKRALPRILALTASDDEQVYFITAPCTWLYDKCDQCFVRGLCAIRISTLHIKWNDLTFL